MLFNSWQFLIFFPTVLLFFYAFPFHLRWLVLLVASLYFYMAWKPIYILLLLATASLDYFAALYMDNPDRTRRQRRAALFLSLAGNLGILFFYKYYNFFAREINTALTALNMEYAAPLADIILPLGISFYTFQSMSYSIDVYRGDQKAQRNYAMFILFVTFFPQLVAGPIERSTDLMPQFYKKTPFDFIRVRDGIVLMIWGFFKKCVVADRVSQLVNVVYAEPSQFQGLTLITATVFFAFQIYCDFSGYTDIAIGAAKTIGFTLCPNFQRPYFARNTKEFWSRWHISLSTWFRDYLYIPLGGNRRGVARWKFNLFLTFLISGFWHGANWTFLAWGALNGIYLIASISLTPYRIGFAKATGLDKMPYLQTGYRIAFTFFLTCVAWVFFRSASMSDAMAVFAGATRGWENWLSRLPELLFVGLSAKEFGIAIAAIAVLLLGDLLQRRSRLDLLLTDKPAIVRNTVSFGLVIVIIVFGVFKHQEFIYFQF